MATSMKCGISCAAFLWIAISKWTDSMAARPWRRQRLLNARGAKAGRLPSKTSLVLPRHDGTPTGIVAGRSSAPGRGFFRFACGAIHVPDERPTPGDQEEIRAGARPGCTRGHGTKHDQHGRFRAVHHHSAHHPSHGWAGRDNSRDLRWHGVE